MGNKSFKRRMTFEEMSKHMKENSFIIPNRVTVGKYAKNNGYKVYKPMINGRISLFYVNNNIPADTCAEDSDITIQDLL